MNNSLDYYEFYKTEPDSDVFNNLRQLTPEKMLFLRLVIPLPEQLSEL